MHSPDVTGSPGAVLAALKSAGLTTPAIVASFGNPAWDSAPTRILIVRLSPFPDVSRSTSHLFLFAECRRALPQAWIDLAFFPEYPDRMKLAAHGLPWFHGLASGRPVSAFDIVLVSNAFTLELINLPALFATAGLPLYASERARLGADRPLVVMGGSNVQSAGAVVCPDGDSLVDGLFFGEGEGAVGNIVRLLADRSLSPKKRLARAAAVRGFWPALSKRTVRKRIVRNAAAEKEPGACPILNSEEAATARLQIARGCPAFCSFCLQGWERKPYREMPAARLLAAARSLKRQTGAHTLDVCALNFNMHSDVFKLILELNRIFRHVNFMSQRIDILAQIPLLFRAESAAGKRTFALGVEGVSSRMRAYYRKSVSDEDLGKVVRTAVLGQVRELKLFYLLSGFEKQRDFAEFAGFVGRLKHDRAAYAPAMRVIFSFGYLVRLPNTPMQFESLLLDEAVWRRLANAAQKTVEPNGFEFRLSQHLAEYGAEQILALGGGALAEWIAQAHLRGHCFDKTLSAGAWADLKLFAESRGILNAELLRTKDASFRPPLAFAAEDTARQDLLYEEFCEAKKHVDAGICLGTACRGCGACASNKEKKRLTGHSIAVPECPDFPDRIRKLIKWKDSFVPVFAAVDVPETMSGSKPETLASWFLSTLFSTAPESPEFLFEAREVLFSTGPLRDMLPAFYGKTCFAVYGSDKDRAEETIARAGFRLLPEAPAPDRVCVELTIPPDIAKNPEQSFGKWLAAEHVPHTLIKHGKTYGYAIGEKGRKRKIVLDASTEPGTDGVRFSLVLGTKARLGNWFKLLGCHRHCATGPIRVTAAEPLSGKH